MSFKAVKLKDNIPIIFVIAFPAVLGIFMLFGRPQIHPQLAYQKPYIHGITDFSLFGYSPLGEDMLGLMAWGYWQTVLVAVFGRGLALLLSFLGLFIAWTFVLPRLSIFKFQFKSHFGFFWMSRFSEAFMTIPSLLLALSLGYLIGEGFYTMIIVIGVSEWAFNQKWLLGRLNEYKRFPFIEASKAMGGGKLHIYGRHFLSFILSDLFFLFFLYLPGSLLTVTALEFLGLSSGSEIAGLGSIIALNKDLIFFYPHVILPPSALIIITVFISLVLKNKFMTKFTDLNKVRA
ncbi:MAG: ABC transporter permease subunit [Spirochaetia bacterium]|nr:ABC transporter permease subunit [Spirochaetia bacterium]